jgi:hypothetical protein
MALALVTDDARRYAPAWRWIAEHYLVRNGDTGKPVPFVMFPWIARILLDVLPEGVDHLPYSLCLYATIKKSGKTAVNGAIAAYLLFERAPSGSEMYVFANSQDQSVGRVFAAVKYAAERNQAMREACEAIQGTSIRLRTGSFLAAQAAMNANVAGANPYASYWTELWGYQLDNELRTWDEMTPPPTVVNSIRVVDTYAGYEGESTLLNGIEDRLRAGRRLYADGYTLPAAYLSLAEGQIQRDPSLARFLLPDDQQGDTLYYRTPLPCYVDDVGRSYGYWDEGEEARRMPWQQGELGARYYAEQERTLLPGAYRRFHLNMRAKRGGQFVPLASWDMLPACDPWKPGDRRPVVLGLDAATKRDHMALVGVQMRGAMPEQCYSREWEPTADVRAGGQRVIDPADALVELRRLRAAGMRIAAVAYDPYQLASVALQAAGEGFPMREFSQGPPRLLADTALRDRIQTGALAHTHDPVLRAAVESADAREQGVKAGEGGRWRIVKGTGKVDSLVALSMAVHQATGGAAAKGVREELPQGMRAGEMIMSGPMDDWSQWDPGKEDDLGSFYVGG